jgi:hypothetical protein
MREGGAEHAHSKALRAKGCKALRDRLILDVLFVKFDIYLST